MVIVWHDEMQRWLATEKLDPPDRCLCEDCLNERKRAMETKEARRKTFDVEYVDVTEENIENVAEWCGGAVNGEGKDAFIKLIDKTAMNLRQTKAFVGDVVTKKKGTTSFKAFTRRAFEKSYDALETVEVSRSAETGQFVSHEEAAERPETTVTETIQVAKEIVDPKQPYWEVINRETIYYNGKGDVITKAEFDAWGK